MTRFRTAAVCLAAVFLTTSGFQAVAQQPGSAAKVVSMLCKIAPGGRGIIRGFVMVTLSNISTSTIPKGQTLFAKKANKTVQFRADKDMPSGVASAFKTSNGAFLSEGECEGWYSPK